jgi:hypothetical protein
MAVPGMWGDLLVTSVASRPRARVARTETQGPDANRRVPEHSPGVPGLSPSVSPSTSFVTFCLGSSIPARQRVN